RDPRQGQGKQDQGADRADDVVPAHRQGEEEAPEGLRLPVRPALCGAPGLTAVFGASQCLPCAVPDGVGASVPFAERKAVRTYYPDLMEVSPCRTAFDLVKRHPRKIVEDDDFDDGPGERFWEWDHGDPGFDRYYRFTESYFWLAIQGEYRLEPAKK